MQAALQSRMQSTISIEVLDSRKIPSYLDDSQTSESTKVMPSDYSTLGT